MKVVIIGSGNVATNLAIALSKAEVKIIQVWSNHLENAKLLAAQVGATAIVNLSEVNVTADFCLVAVKDNAIVSVINQLKQFRGILAHTAGSVGMDVFGSGPEKFGVLYPLQTFSKNYAISFEDIPLCLEASTKQTLEHLKGLASLLSKKVVEIDSDKRKILHLAAVFACNFTNYLYNLSAQLLHDNQIPFDVIRPLILETAEKVQWAMPVDVQTGPAFRNDEQTINKHLVLLADQPELAKIYSMLSDGIKNGE